MNATETEAPAAPPARTIPWATIWSAAGGAAGLAAIVYILGAAIEALRLNHAGIPVETAMSLVPRSTLFALAANALIVPALIQVGVVALTITGIQQAVDRAADHLLTPEAVAKRHARRSNPSKLRRAMRWCGGELRGVARRCRATPAGRIVSRGAALLGVATQPLLLWPAVWLVVPFQVFTIIIIAAINLQLRVQNRILGKRERGEITRRAEAVLIGLLVGLVISSETIVHEILRPDRLASATVRVAGSPNTVTGIYLGTTLEGVFVGEARKIVMIPSHLVEKVTVYNVARRPDETPRTLIQRLGG